MDQHLIIYQEFPFASLTEKRQKGSGPKSDQRLSVRYFEKRAREEMAQIDWRRAIEDDCKDLIASVTRYFPLQRDKQYKENVKRMVQFVDYVLKKSQSDPAYQTPEAYYFTMKYAIAIIDEEHTRLTHFKFTKMLKRLQIIPSFIYENQQVVDKLSKQPIVKINGQPVTSYIQTILRFVPLLCEPFVKKAWSVMEDVAVYNPFFPVRSITLADGRQVTHYNQQFVQGFYTSFRGVYYDQQSYKLPKDMGLLYIPCKTFAYVSWDRSFKDWENERPRLIVIDLRNNGGGSPLIQMSLFIDVIKLAFRNGKGFPALFKKIIKDITAYLSTSYQTPDTLYEEFLAFDQESTRLMIKGLNKRQFSPSKTIVPAIRKMLKESHQQRDYVSVIAVLVNENCYSASRMMLIMLSALGNVIFAGNDVDVKNPVGYYEGFAEHSTPLIKYTIPTSAIRLSPPPYKTIRASIKGNFIQSGLKHAIQLYNNLPILSKMVAQKIKKDKRTHLFMVQ